MRFELLRWNHHPPIGDCYIINEWRLCNVVEVRDAIGRSYFVRYEEAVPV